MPTLAEIRAKLLAQENRKDRSNSPLADNLTYRFWNLQDGETAVVRFLPDGDKKNTYFWVEKLTVTLDFPGVKGDPMSKPVEVHVPCMEMWGEPCYIMTEIRPWWKNPATEELARKYWKNRTYLFQGFVRKSPLVEDNPPENPIRRFSFRQQLMKPIKAALMDPEFEDLPFDYENGLDFHIIKGTSGKFADYSTSKWARKTSPLTDDELKAIETFGLFDLKSWLPAKPGEVELQVIKEMFEASVEGKPYDQERWGKYYRPYNLKRNNDEYSDYDDEATDEPTSRAGAKQATDDDAKPATSISKPSDNESPVKATTATPGAMSGGSRAEDILAMIRNRQQKTVA